MNRIEKEDRHAETIRLAESIKQKVLDDAQADYNIALDRLAFTVASSATIQSDCKLFVNTLLKKITPA